MDLKYRLINLIKANDLDGVKKLLVIGISNVECDRALRIACMHGCLDIVKLLLREGADINSFDGDALANASKHGYVEIVDVLLKAGADVHAHNDEALYWSCNDRHIAVVIKLVEAGADLRVLQGGWVRLFGCKAPSNLVDMCVEEVNDLLCVESVRKELI